MSLDYNAVTILQEVKYAKGLEFTFVNSEVNTAAEYTYIVGQIVNIMDYSHNTGIKRISTLKFEWYTIKPNLTKE